MYSMVEPQHRPSHHQSWSSRIMNSATGLTRDIFQGPSTLPHPNLLAGKATSSSSSSSLSSTAALYDLPRRRAGGAILACDFRRIAEAEEERQREAEFKCFAESGVGSWNDGESEGMCACYAETQAKVEDERMQDPVLEVTGEQSIPMPLRSFERVGTPSNFVPPKQMDRAPNVCQVTATETNELWSNLDEVEEIWNRSRSAAVERLRQVHGHFEGGSKVKRHVLRPIHPLPEDAESFQRLLQNFQQEHPQSSHGDEDELEITYFHCPHMDCHRRLGQQNSNLPNGMQTRVCVHTGCGFVSQSVEEWIVHCTQSEHHLVDQGSSNAERRQSYSRCMTLEDTHVCRDAS